MKKVLIALLFVVAGTFVSGNALAFTAYIPHITAGENNWTDYLQANNNTSFSANFTLTLYNGGGIQIYSNVFSAGGLSRSQIQLKALHPDAETGVITYTESGLIFRVSYNNIGGGIAEFKAIDTLGSNIGLYFSDFTSFVQWKGAAIANMGSAPAVVTLHAFGGGAILGTHTVAIAPKTKAVGVHSAWFSSLNLSQVESIIAVTDSSSLCGIAIGGDIAQTRLLFTLATPVSNFTGVAFRLIPNCALYYGADYAGMLLYVEGNCDFATYPNCALYQEADYAGMLLYVMHNMTADACKQICRNDAECAFFYHNARGGLSLPPLTTELNDCAFFRGTLWAGTSGHSDTYVKRDPVAAAEKRCADDSECTFFYYNARGPLSLTPLYTDQYAAAFFRGTLWAGTSGHSDTYVKTIDGADAWNQ